MQLSKSDTALIATIYDPPRARHPWSLTDVLPAGETRFYSLARWALVDALRVCGVRSGDRVLLPELICREVMASVHVLRAEAVFYPVSPQFCPSCSADDLTEAKAVLAVNYFGFPQELSVFREYCQRTGAALIEDNAHGFLSRDTSGELLGSRGDLGLFSFRKTIPVPDGGALILNRHRAELGIADDHVVTGTGTRYRVKQMFRRVSRRLGPVGTQRAIGGVRRLRRIFKGESVPLSTVDAETRIPLASSPRALLSTGLSVADPEVESQRRRALYELVGRIGEAAGIPPAFANLPPNVVPHGFPIFASSTLALKIAAELGRCGLPLNRWPALPAAVEPSAAAHYRDLLVVPFLW